MLSRVFAMTSEESEGMRRVPRQERGRLRVAQILDAAELVFGEHGFEAATTNQIAAQAGVPIGSLYQFFDNKQALLHAVAARYRDGAREALVAALPFEHATSPATDLAARLLHAMVAFGAERMAITRIVLQAGANDELAAAAAGIMSDASNHFAQLLAARLPALPAERTTRSARVALTAVMALLGLVTAEKAHGEAHTLALLAETHVLLGAYIAALDDGSSADWPASDGTIKPVV